MCCRSGEGRSIYHSGCSLLTRYHCITKRNGSLLDQPQLWIQIVYMAWSPQYNVYVACERDLGGFPVIHNCTEWWVWKDFFFLKKSLFVPWDFSHFLVDNTVFYSSCIKLSVWALYVCLEDSKQMTGTIAGGRKTHLDQNLQRSASLGSPAPASTWWTPSHTFFFLCVISHCW